MSGLQSNYTPQQMPDQRADRCLDELPPQSSDNVPLDTDKRDSERLQSTEMLDVINVEENEGKPVWLRSWPSEIRREILTNRYATSHVASPPQSDARQTTDDEPPSNLRAIEPEIAASYTNGYTGRSIEAGFSFETVYHFETEFEAEATEDWLNLSGDVLGADGKILMSRNNETPLPNSELGVIGEQESPLDATDGSVFAPGHRNVPASFGEAAAVASRPSDLGAPLNPQAVRAAIFRLAHESPIARNAVMRPRNAPDNAEFAEVALRMWGESEDSLSAIAQTCLADAKEDESHLANESDPNARQEVEGLVEPATGSPQATEIGVIDGGGQRIRRESFDSEQETESASLQPAPGPMIPHDANVHAVQNFRDASAVAIKQTIAIAGTAAMLPSALPEVVEAPKDVESSSVLPGAKQQQRWTTSGAPALAHDAGNLLSALTLYSELLALSGVLHARHEHYAQDLKLLAARSEVLISRLLASCNQSELRERSSIEESARQIPTPPCPELYRGAASSLDLDLSATERNHSDFDIESSTIANRANNEQSSYPQNASALGGTALLDSDQPKQEQIIPTTPDTDKTRSESSDVDPINLVDLLTRWRNLLSMIGRGAVEVNFGPNSALPIRVPEDSMERILVNLVHNAMTATRSGGSIRIGVGRVEKRRSALSMPSPDGRAHQGNTVVLTVDDSGCGMTQEQLTQIFQGVPSAADDLVDAADLPRRGMGLQIVRELVSASGGHLAIQSRCGSGTRIEMEWPVAVSGATLARIPPGSVRSNGALENDPLSSDRSSREYQTKGTCSLDLSCQANSHTADSLKGAIAC